MGQVSPIRAGDTETKWKEMTPGTRKVIDTVMKSIKGKFVDAWEEVNAGVNSSGAQGSVSATLEIKEGKAGRFKGKLKTRVRTPQEPVEFDLKLNDDGQLELTPPSELEEEPE